MRGDAREFSVTRFVMLLSYNGAEQSVELSSVSAV